MNEIIPCEGDKDLREKIVAYAEVLRTESHKLGDHGYSEYDFYASGLFRGAVERIRGQYSSGMGGKREFVKHILNYMEDHGSIQSWDSAGGKNRHDYTVTLNDGRIAVIELKGCLDGNNTIIYERPSHAEEFILWSVCTNPGADPRRNVWSGINARLSADIIERNQQVDGLIVWDMLCGTAARPCPKIVADPSSVTEVGPFLVPPPCIYLFPATIPSVRNNPHPVAQTIDKVAILDAFHRCFKGADNELNLVDFEVGHVGGEVVRKTRSVRGGIITKESLMTPIRRK